MAEVGPGRFSDDLSLREHEKDSLCTFGKCADQFIATYSTRGAKLPPVVNYQVDCTILLLLDRMIWTYLLDQFPPPAGTVRTGPQHAAHLDLQLEQALSPPTPQPAFATRIASSATSADPYLAHLCFIASFDVAVDSKVREAAVLLNIVQTVHSIVLYLVRVPPTLPLSLFLTDVANSDPRPIPTAYSEARQNVGLPSSIAKLPPPISQNHPANEQQS